MKGKKIISYNRVYGTLVCALVVPDHGLTGQQAGAVPLQSTLRGRGGSTHYRVFASWLADNYDAKNANHYSCSKHITIELWLLHILHSACQPTCKTLYLWHIPGIIEGARIV